MNGDATPMPGNSPEPGAEDNLLHLNPADERWKDTVGEWQDGEFYDIEKMKVQQLSSGELKVVSMVASKAPSSESETPAEDASAGEESDTSAYPANPAIAKMMAGPKR